MVRIPGNPVYNRRVYDMVLIPVAACNPVVQQWQDTLRLCMIEFQMVDRKYTPVGICGFIKIDQGSEDLVGGQGYSGEQDFLAIYPNPAGSSPV
jgi:hypothetical protein